MKNVLDEPISLRDAVAVLDSMMPEVVGNTDRTILGIAPLRDCGGNGYLTFCKIKGQDASDAILDSKADVVICHRESNLGSTDKTLIKVDNPRLAFVRIVSEFFVAKPKSSIHPTAVIHPKAEIGENVTIGAQCYVGQAVVGTNTVLSEGVIVLDGTKIGKSVKVAPGTVIGGDGFGYERNEHGELEKFPHIGGVVIEDFVEIGCNTCIDRGSLADTRIRARAKIDNLVHIAHNVEIGEDAAVIALSIIGGSVRIGSRAWVAPSAVIRNQVIIGENATVGLGAVVTKNVDANATVLGNPAKNLKEFRQMMKAISLIARQGS